jgi:glucuronoarabinoxylan endo-1,4-beta-xylanase
MYKRIVYFAAVLTLSLLFAQEGLAATGTVNYNTAYQELEGFGGAAVYDCPALTTHPKKEEIYDLLFKELGLEILRIRNTYGYPDSGTNLDATAAIIAEAREPQRSPNIKTELVPWSPPAYLKSNNDINNGGTLKGGPSNYVYTDYAQWWYDSLLEWQAHGVNIDFISIQNEPDTSTSYDSCRFAATQSSSYAGYDRAFEAVFNKLNSQMGASMPEMWAPETMGFGNSTSYISGLSSRGQINNVDGFSHHLYTDGSYDSPDGMITGMTNYGNTYGYKPLHMTEYVKLNTTPNFDMAWKFAWHIYNCLYYEGVTSFFNWTLFRGPTSQGGIVTFSSSNYVIRPQYWFLKGYTRFTDAGWYVVDTSVSGTGASNLRMSAFKSPDNTKLTIVILNVTTSSTSLTLSLNNFTPSSSEVYRSSQSENWVSLGTYNPSLTIPGQSITTIALTSGGGAPDTTPPTPDPMTWASYPTATGSSTITMTATTATDATSPPVQYYFECTNDSSKSSGWQSSTTYVASGLTPSTQYSFRVRARDSAATPNVTGWSSTQSATTTGAGATVTILGTWVTGTSHTKEAGTNRALIFIAHGERTGTMNLSAVRYGGQSMTKVVERNYSAASGYAYVVSYILKEAGVAVATSSTFTLTWSGTAPSAAGYSSVFLSNVNQTTATGATGSGGSTTNPVTTSALATSSGDMVIDAATCGNAGSYTLNNNFIEGTDQQMGGTATGVTGRKSATGANETPSATYSGTINRQAIIGLVVKHQ